jgi:hypothetical protein
MIKETYVVVERTEWSFDPKHSRPCHCQNEDERNCRQEIQLEGEPLRYGCECCDFKGVVNGEITRRAEIHRTQVYLTTTINEEETTRTTIPRNFFDAMSAAANAVPVV